MPGRPFPVRCLPGLLSLAVALSLLAPPAPAEEPESGWTGVIQGQVVDGKRGSPIGYATITLIWPDPPDGSEPKRVHEVSDPNGAFEFREVPAGTYTLKFSKQGYQTSTLLDFTLSPGQLDRADFQLPPVSDEPPEAAAGGAGVPPPPQDAGVEEFLVLGARVVALEASREESDKLINTLTSEEFTKFAASDVGDAIKRIAGINVVEGQFAIIRGLEDRYSSTLYNSAPIPSPDPNSQSVQLDLLPSEVVSNLVVAKTFAPDLPSNSAGGSIDIITHAYPETFEIGVKGGAGFDTNAVDDFLEYQHGSPMGKSVDAADTVESELGAWLGGRTKVLDRELRYKAVGAWEIDTTTAQGFQEAREPRAARVRNFPRPPTIVQSGDLALGQLNLSGGRFDLTESGRAEQGTGYVGLGIDLDPAGSHKLDGSIFYTHKTDEVVQLLENGYLPNFDYGTLDPNEVNGNADFDGFATPSAWIARSVRGDPNDAASRGPLWLASFFQSASYEIERDLLVTQLNGEHYVDQLHGLHFAWAANYAHTSETEDSLGARYFYEPDDAEQVPALFPTTPGSLGPGRYAVNSGVFSNDNDIKEDQGFGRLDIDYERPLSEQVTLTFRTGGWFEHATRNVDSSFLESPSLAGSSQFVIFGDTPEQLGGSIFDALDRGADGEPSFNRQTTNSALRQIGAWNLGSKATLWQEFDLLGGLRVESIKIESNNDPFIGEDRFGAPEIFPSRYLFFDRLDNPARGEVSSPPPPDTTFNDQLLGIDVPIDPVTGLVDLDDAATIDSFVNGKIDEIHTLPAFGFSYRPLPGLALRGAYSQTVARPSFREMGFYVSVEPATDDLIVGNPQLGLSDVTSWDGRIEYFWGEFGDLLAASGFYKTIHDPIESIVVRNPLNFEGSSSALYRTFFNNPNTASLWGIELEGRKSFDFLGWDFAQFVSIGGNFTYIDASVDRSEIELARSRAFFGTAAGDEESFGELSQSRRLFGQPEWIANADLTLDHPEWGTRATLAFFAISDVLDAAGSATISPNGTVISYTLDRYVDSFSQLDLILSQTFYVDWLAGDVTFKLSAKNLTDSTRRIVYDPYQTSGKIPERSYRIGRDFKFSISYQF